MTEVAIVLGIVGIVLGAVWAATSVVYTHNKIRLATQQLQAIVNNTRAVYAEQGGIVDPGGTALTQALDQLKVFPVDMRQDQDVAAGILFHPWTQQVANGLGTVFISGSDCTGHVFAAGTPEPCFYVEYNALPRDGCIILVSQTTATEMNLGINVIEVSGIGAGLGSGFPLPISASTAERLCISPTSNSVKWSFALKTGGS